MIARAALAGAVIRLRDAGIEDAARDARVLLSHAMGIRPDRLTLYLHDDLESTQEAAFAAAIVAREGRQPVSQITGSRLFWGRPFRVTPDVLDPRPETEALVAEALKEPFSSVLDLGTGSGCILLTLVLERPETTGTGIDTSDKALIVAGENARDHGLSDRIILKKSDWFRGLAGSDRRFDLIVSNPPYIAAAEMADLAPEVRDHEPVIALSPGGDGLDAYRAIAAGATRHLQPGGRILLEIGPTQGRAVAAFLAGAGLGEVRILPDLDGRDRVVAGRRPAMSA